MALLNYTTKIPAWQTVSEIQQLLAKAGASHFSVKNEGSDPIAISFTIDFKGQPLNFLLPCNFKGVAKTLVKNKNSADQYRPGLHGSREQYALNVGWRILKDWIEAQTALITVEMATIQEVFMQYLIVNAQGETLAAKMLYGDGLKRLGNG